MTKSASYIIILFVAERCDRQDAEVAELADAHGSGPCGSNTVRVQVSSSARRLKQLDDCLSLFVIMRYGKILLRAVWRYDVQMHIEAERTADRALAENSRCFLCFMGDRILQKTLWGMHTRGDEPGRLQYDNRNINILVIFTEIVYNK